MSHTQMAVDFNPDPLNGDDYSPPSLYPQEPKSYALSGKIMLTAIIVLLFVVLLMIALHLYARWYLLHRRRRNLFLRRNRHNRRTHIVFYSPDNAATASRGLDSSVLKSLPLFTYFSAEHHQQPLECAVCLSEFDDGETARLLPKCKHSFHVNCIDMWFHSHSTCPLCRSPVEAPQPEADHNPEEAVVVSLVESDCPEAAAIGSSSGVCVVCEHEEQAREPGPSSIDGRRKPMEIVGVSIEVPRRSLAAEELACDSPASRHRSPMSRMLSFTRILGRERRGNLSPATPTELDVERGLGREDVHAQQ